MKFQKIKYQGQHFLSTGDGVSIIKVKSIFATFISLGIITITSGSIATDNLALNKIPIRHYISFENVNTPDSDTPMGFLGLYYLVDITNWLNAGMVSYGAISGNQGGLFTLGLVTSTRLPIS